MAILAMLMEIRWESKGDPVVNRWKSNGNRHRRSWMSVRLGGGGGREGAQLGILWKSPQDQWTANGNPMDIRANSLVIHWKSRQIQWDSNGNPCNFNGHPLEIQWKSNGNPCRFDGIPMVTLAILMEIQW